MGEAGHSCPGPDPSGQLLWRLGPEFCVLDGLAVFFSRPDGLSRLSCAGGCSTVSTKERLKGMVCGWRVRGPVSELCVQRKLPSFTWVICLFGGALASVALGTVTLLEGPFSPFLIALRGGGSSCPAFTPFSLSSSRLLSSHI